MILVVNGLPPDLYVAEEDHAIWPPVLDGVRKDIRIHEGAPGLASEELPKFAIGVSQAECCLSSVNPNAKQFKFEDGLQITIFRGNQSLYAETRLPYAS